VFASQVGEQGLIDKSAFIQGISLALTTTMVGLCIAIPALVGNSYLHRRIEMLAMRLEMGVERLIDLAKRR
jgi:biopolymer transport protein ExbB